MTKTSSISSAIISDIETPNQIVAGSCIDRIVMKISAMELPGTEHFESYMRYKWRMNHRPNTIRASYTQSMH